MSGFKGIRIGNFQRTLKMVLGEGEDLQLSEFRKISSDVESFYQEKENFLKRLKVSQPCPMYSTH